MSGNVKIRKQWQLQGKGVGSLRRLRSQLAEDGCAESQIVIARQLLEDADNDSDENNSKKSEFDAIGWLLKAAKLADVEALDLLRDCFAVGKGINNKNYGEVKTFLDLDKDEREFNVTARKIFHSLTTSQDDYVTTNQLMLMLLPTDEDLSSNSIQYDGDRLSEEELVSLAAKLCKGEMPKVILPTHESLSYKNKESNRAAVIENFPVSVKQFLLSSHKTLLQAVSNMIKKAFCFLFSWHMFHTILLMFLCNALTVNLLIVAFPLFCFYIGIAIMASASIELVTNAYEMPEFNMWLNVFLQANAQLDIAISRKKFTSKCVYIYCQMAIGFLLTIFMFPHCQPAFVLHSCVFALSAAMHLFLWFTLNTCVNIHLLVHTVLCIFAIFSRHMHMLEFGLPSEFAFGALQWLPLAGILATFSWPLIKSKDIYSFILPNLGAMMWIYLGSGLYDDVLWCNAAYAFIGWVLLIMCPIVFAIFVTVCCMYFSLQIEHFMSILLSSVLVVVEFLLVKKLLNSRTKLKIFAFAVQLTFIISMMFMMIPLVWPENSTPITSQNETSSLDWETYQQLCKNPIGVYDIQMPTKLACSQLTGTEITWEGQVLNVAVASVQNRFEESLQSLPSVVAEKLRCLFGSSYHKWCAELHGLEYERCSTIAYLSNRDCHVRSWDNMIFHIIVQMSKGYWNSAEVTLEASDKFQDFVVNLQSGDFVQYTGTLRLDLLKSRPHIKLLAIKCKLCVQKLVDIDARDVKSVNAEGLAMKSIKFFGWVLRIF